MNSDYMIHELRRLSHVHQNDRISTFEPNWSNICRDCADKIEELESQNDQLRTILNIQLQGVMNANSEDKKSIFELIPRELWDNIVDSISGAFMYLVNKKETKDLKGCDKDGQTS